MAKTDPFVAMTECHFMNEQSMAEMSYYPGSSAGGGAWTASCASGPGAASPAAAACRSRAPTR